MARVLRTGSVRERALFFFCAMVRSGRLTVKPGRKDGAPAGRGGTGVQTDEKKRPRQRRKQNGVKWARTIDLHDVNVAL